MKRASFLLGVGAFRPEFYGNGIILCQNVDNRSIGSWSRNHATTSPLEVFSTMKLCSRLLIVLVDIYANKKANDFGQKVQAAAIYITSIGSNIVTLPTVLQILHINNCDSGFWPLKVIQGHQIWLCQSKAHGCFVVLRGVQPRICHRFKIFRIKGLLPWPLTSEGHPKWSPWALYIICVGSSIVTLAVLDIFHVKKYNLEFWPLKVIQSQTWVELSWVGFNVPLDTV